MGEERNYCAIFLSTKETARMLVKYHQLEKELSNEDNEKIQNNDAILIIPDSFLHGNGYIDPNSFCLAIGNDDKSITMKSLIGAMEYFFEYLPFLNEISYPPNLDIEIYDDEDKLKFCQNFNKETFEYLVRSMLTKKEKELGWTLKFIYFGEEE